jgi:hypothetical protein
MCGLMTCCLCVWLLLQDMHTFAYKAMELGTKGADSLQEKLLRVLAVLNSQPHDQQQQQQQPQLPQLPSQQQPDPQLQQQPDQQLSEQAQQLSEQAQQQPSQQQQQQEGHDPMQPAIEASAAAGSNTPHYFSLSDVQAAARVNPQWLTLSADTLEARLVGIQQALEVRGSSHHKETRVLAFFTTYLGSRGELLSEING